MKLSQTLTARALLAVVLMFGFYALALGIAAALFWIPYAEYLYVGRVHFKLAAVCLGAGGTILWALVPRADRFEPPGPLLTTATAPRLFALVEKVARDTSQRPPEEVYLLNDVNAWVSHRGGVMGFGSKRVMGVGLPLLHNLSPSEIEAVIAHEFGHYCSGDVALGPWIYKTRAAIARTLTGVKETIFEAPFRWYGNVFLKMTMAVSRRQEFIADETAARVAGREAMASALKKVAILAPAYSMYVRNEVFPVLQSGFIPPIADGFRRFIAHQGTRPGFESFVNAITTGDQSSEFDTHPPLADRLAALNVSPQTTTLWSEAPTEALIEGPEQQARVLFEAVIGPDAADQLKAIPWEAVAESVYVERWRRIVNDFREWFGTLTIDQIPSGKAPYIEMGSRLVGREEVNINSDQRIGRAIQVMSAGLGSALIRADWRPETGPGRPLILVKGDHVLDPTQIIAGLFENPESYKEWRARCEALGIAGLPLQDSVAIA